jgi:hypothetical protein
MRAVSVRRTFALCAASLSLVVFPASAGATSSQTQIDAAIADAIEYVRSEQEAATGAVPGFGGDWMATSLAAAGLHPADLHGPGLADPSFQDFLLDEYTQPTWDEDPPGGTVSEYARSTLVATAAGLDPARLSATSNQPAQLAGRWNPAIGSFGEASANNTAFAILALRATPLPAWALASSVSFLRRNQHKDGGWTYAAALTPIAQGEPSEEDMTGAAIAALCEAGVPAYDPAVASALTYLRGRLVNATGGIEYLWGAPNSDINAWVVSGLTACGIDPQSPAWTTAAGKTPIDFLLSVQVPAGGEAGGFGYEDASFASLYSTQDALRAISGGVFAVAAPDRIDPSQPRLRSAPSVADGTPVPHLLAIELAPGNVRICKVTAPAGAALSEVLAAAEAASHPAGCVTSFSVAGGKVESIDGVFPGGEDEAWLLRLDRGAAAVAGEQPVGFGQVVSLRLGQRPAGAGGSTGSQQGPAGSTGTPGPAGPAGKPGQRGKKRTCKSRRQRAGKGKRHCKDKQRRGRYSETALIEGWAVSSPRISWARSSGGRRCPAEAATKT